MTRLAWAGLGWTRHARRKSLVLCTGTERLLLQTQFMKQ